MYASATFTDCSSGQASASYVQWSETPLPDTHQRVGSSVPLPTAAEWHTSDASLPSPSSLSLLYPSSPESPSTSATSPPSSSRASSPSVSIPGSPRPQRKTASRRSAKDPSHIPRPRNPFILYRSEVCERLRRTNVENDHRKISQIIGDMWRKEPATVRQHYKIMAAREKEEHARLYPHYRFTPQARAVPPKKRNVKRNGEIDRQRCKLIAEILQKGDSNNQKLEQEVNDFDRRRQEEIMRRAAYETGDPYTTTVFNVWGSPSTSSLSSPSSGSPSGETPFRSPLLPPATPPSASASPDTAIEDACNSLAPLQLGPGPEESYNDFIAEPAHLSVPEVIVDAVHSQAASFPSDSSFGALPSQEQDVLGMSNLYMPQNAFDATIPGSQYLQNVAMFSVDPPFQAQAPSYDAGNQIAEGNLGIAPYQPGFQLEPQQMPQLQGHPQPQFDPLAFTAGYPGDFGISLPYDATQHNLYPLPTWSSGQVNGLEVSLPAEPVHLGAYVSSF